MSSNAVGYFTLMVLCLSRTKCFNLSVTLINRDEERARVRWVGRHQHSMSLECVACQTKFIKLQMLKDFIYEIYQKPMNGRENGNKVI